jgi:hypothetical protein
MKDVHFLLFKKDRHFLKIIMTINLNKQMLLVVFTDNTNEFAMIVYQQ